MSGPVGPDPASGWGPGDGFGAEDEIQLRDPNWVWVEPTAEQKIEEIKELLDELRPECEWRVKRSPDDPNVQLARHMMGMLTSIVSPTAPDPNAPVMLA
jgi:hypothetical protein